MMPFDEENKFKSKLCANVYLSVDAEKNLIEIETKISGLYEGFFKKVLNLEDIALREALIQFGWTPPKEK